MSFFYMKPIMFAFSKLTGNALMPEG